MATCKGCGAEISFVRMSTGKLMPVDPKPVFYEDANGDEPVLISDDGRVTRGRVGHVASDRATRCYKSHFSTCPKAATFRKRGKP